MTKRQIAATFVLQELKLIRAHLNNMTAKEIAALGQQQRGTEAGATAVRKFVDKFTSPWIARLEKLLAPKTSE